MFPCAAVPPDALGALQAMEISTGLPFTIILIVLCIGITKGLMSEKRA